MLLTTVMSFGNQWLGNDNLDIRILVAGGVVTGALALVEQIPDAKPIAVGVAWIAFLTLMFTRLDGKPSPVDNIHKLTGF